MLMVAHMGEGGVKNCQKYAHVVYGRPLRKTVLASWHFLNSMRKTS